MLWVSTDGDGVFVLNQTQLYIDIYSLRLDDGINCHG